ncbi:hypothetical protein [Aquabacterium sp. CECT 9606]|uniref:hypothetical protein n=1 Tax=Aquabacterium sp. CECT 9606 TaxID=2845822 RepID=UPI001E5004B3|nr:hypothetical protein [Aquabacterium sp. CECT 9606]CAH0356090.1 hypothetical protein AQB9606_04553 [Aquabacterium sp. CECT 9606]
MNASTTNTVAPTTDSGFPPEPSEAHQRAQVNFPALGGDWMDELDEEVIDLLASMPESPVALDCLKVIWQADVLLGLMPDARDLCGLELPIGAATSIRRAVAHQCAVFYFG